MYMSLLGPWLCVQGKNNGFFVCGVIGGGGWMVGVSSLWTDTSLLAARSSLRLSLCARASHGL